MKKDQSARPYTSKILRHFLDLSSPEKLAEVEKRMEQLLKEATWEGSAIEKARIALGEEVAPDIIASHEQQTYIQDAPQFTADSVAFAEGNNIRYCQDLRLLRGIPHGVSFYPDGKIGEKIIKFVGDGYGIDNRKHKISGEYGNGPIYICSDDFPLNLFFLFSK